MYRGNKISGFVTVCRRFKVRLGILFFYDNIVFFITYRLVIFIQFK